jgi:WD40 repeat protein
MLCAAYSADCTKVACGFQDSVVRVFDVNAAGARGVGRVPRHMEHVRPKSQDVNHVGEDGRGSRLSSYVDGPVASGSAGADRAVVTGRTGGVYRNIIAGAGGGPEAGGAMVELVGHSKPVYGVSQDAHVSLVASTSADRTIRLWNTSLVKCVSKYSTMAPCWDVAFGPLGYYFAAAGHDRTATVYATDRLTPLRIFVGHVSDVTCVRWHPNSALVVTGSDDRTCRMWDVRVHQNNCVRLFQGPCCNNVSAIDVAPNGALLAAGNLSSNNQAYVFDIGSSKLVGICCEEGGTKASTHAVTFDSSSRTLVTGGDDCTIRTWDMDGLTLPSLMANSSTPNAVSLIAPSIRLCTKSTAVFALKFATTGLRGNGILFGAGPLDADRVKEEARNRALGEGLAARSVGINYAIPDALSIR